MDDKLLLPCPFCGGEANLDELTPTPYNDQHSTCYSVGCINCGIGFYENTKDEATAAWNRRADAVPVVRCRECKSHGTLKSGELFCGKIKTGIYGYYHTVKADDYCSYGERKEDRK